MSFDRDINARLNLVVDPQMTQKVNAASQQVNAGLQQVGKADPFRRLVESTADFTTAAKVADTEVRNLSQSIDQISDLQSEVNLGGGGGGTPGAGGAAAGGGIGASGAAGLASQAASFTGLSAEVSGGLGILSSAVGSLGVAGVVVTVALVALTQVMKHFTSIQNEAADAIRLTNALKRDELELVRMTTEQLLALQEARQAEVDITKEALESAKELEAANKDLEIVRASSLSDVGNNFKAFWFDMKDAIGLAGSAGDAASEDVERLTDELTVAEGELENVTTALDSTEVAANDAAEALEKLRDEIGDEFLDAAGDAGEAQENYTAAINRTKEANIEHIESLDASRRAIEAELAVLKAMQSPTEKVTEKIAALTDKLGDLGAEAAETARVAQTQRSEASKKAAEDARKAAKKAADESRAAAKKAAAERKKIRDDALQDQIDFWNDLLDIEFDSQVKRQNIAIDANREQEKLLREASDRFNQDFFQDFLGEFVSQQQLRSNVRETQISAQQSFADVGRETQLAQQQLAADNPQVVGGAISNQFNFPNANQQQFVTLLQNLGII